MGLPPAIAWRQRGATLFESLLAFVVLAFGAVAIAPLQGQLRLHGDTARQRSEAVRLGEQEIETLRAFSALSAASGIRSYDAIGDAATSVDGSSGYRSNTAYRIVRRIDDAAFAGSKSASVTVEWSDRSGSEQRVALQTFIARSAPAYSGALALGAGLGRPRGVSGRSPSIPAAATPLGDGRSAWKPVPSSGTVLVFDDVSGDVVARCSGVAAAAHQLTTGSLVDCESGRWHLLSGTIRFSLAEPPTPAQASEPPLALTVALELTGGPYPAIPACSAEAMKLVRHGSAGSVRLEAVAIDATPASHGLSEWHDSGDRFVAYRCLVAPRADGRWSGRSVLVADGWTIGVAAGERKVCRFATDRDGSGAIDANIEHPADYANVGSGLTAQNFLVVGGTQACPAAPGTGIIEASLGTVQHQP